MSKRRLVITAVLAGQSQSEVARTYGVSQGWISRLMARYRLEGEAAFEPLSRAPDSSPGATPPQTVELVLRLRKQLTEAGLDAGADTIGWHLAHHHATTLSQGDDQPDPGPGRRGHPGPVQAAQELLHPVRSRAAQRDLAVRLHPLPARRRHRLRDPDLARRLLPLRPARSPPTPGSPARSCSRPSATAVARHGVPASTLTDNGMVFTTRFAGGKGGRNHLETRATRAQHHPEERPAQPPPDPGQGRTLPADPEEVATAPKPASPPASPSCRALLDQLHRAVQPPTDRTAPCPTAPPPPPSTRPCRRPPRAATAAPTPTTASATTRSTKPAASPCASPADSATSASAEPTPEPTSSCSSRTSTSPSSTPPPARSCATSSSTPRRDYQPTGRPPGPTKK